MTVHRSLAVAGLTASLLGLAACSAGPSTATNPGSSPRLTTQNLSGVPSAERLVFSRIETPIVNAGDGKPYNSVHDTATLRIQNSGTGPLSIASLTVSGPWQISQAAVPTAVAAGASLDVQLKFVGSFSPSAARVVPGTLTVNSDDPSRPSLTIQLAGLWQSQSENNQEPTPAQIFQVFGYQVNLGGDLSSQHGQRKVQGDEVLSAYWQAADPSQPVQIDELASYEVLGTETTLSWYTPNSNAMNGLFTHEGNDSQSVLPRLKGATTPAKASFTPTGTFGLQVTNTTIGTEYSDPDLNNPSYDQKVGCPAGACGQHMRFWPVHNPDGTLVANTYVIAVDYYNTKTSSDTKSNYDFQDDVFLIRNVMPATP